MPEETVKPSEVKNHQPLEKLELETPPLEGTDQQSPVEILSAEIRRTKERVNALIDDNNIIVEQIAKLEGENDTLKRRVDSIEKALFTLIDRVSVHTHDEQGRASVPLSS